MKKFLINALLFLIVLLAANSVVYQYFAEPLLYKGYFISKRKMKPYRSFLLGDSHAKAVRQEDLNKLHIFNFAYDTDSYFDCALKLKYLVRNKLADTVYICVDNHTLSQYREWWTNKTRSIYYARLEDYVEYYEANNLDFWLAKNINFYIPLFRTENSKLFKKYLLNLIEGNKPKSYVNYDISQIPHENLINRSIDRVKTQFPDSKKSERLVKTLNEMLEICRKNKIVVYGIKFPLTQEYLDAMGPKSYKADSLFVANDYAVYDYSTVFQDSTSFFRDQDHVNYTGSERLVEYILKSGRP